MTSRSSRSAGRYPPRPKKRFGQHFLSDRNILNRIVDGAEVAPGEAVVEIGPGLGALTEVLAERAPRVVAVEVDPDLVAVLGERFAHAPNVAIVAADVLDVAPSEILHRGGARAPYVVVANLPYNIAAAVLRHFLEGDAPPRRLVVMVQQEVAESIVARPTKMSLLGVATQVYAETSMVMRVAPGAFNPPPAVQSAVVRIDVAGRPRVDAPLDVFFRVVRAGFGNSRKQLRNSLSFGMHVKQEVADEVLHDAGIDVTLRPQVLSLEQWAALARAWDQAMRR
ncbi:MAG TPA: 16S rRNA (adenine(1518)-N(6)/adenine(1519)-N(6))-dimethyltransferase RsmA [Dehalococcoidia bacterium]|nr:16S rRNA (adenine(1518)-N(6)/adenine(1519)-N(6))-dimethyltransferase RsmA [Dehalococcoidia bacterium]